MEYLFMTVIACLVALSATAIHHYLSLRRSLTALRRELSAFEKISGAGTAEAAPWIRMVVEVKDPIALARRESALAKLAATSAPHLVTKKVYEQMMVETLDQLKSKNVEANVSLIVL